MLWVHPPNNNSKLFVYNIYDFHLVLSFSESMLMPVIIQDLVIDIETGLANIYIYIYIRVVGHIPFGINEGSDR